MIATLTLDGDLGSARRARAFITSQLAGHDGRVVESATLMVSELVTNSLKHSTGTVTLSLEVTDERVRVDVSDPGPGSPVVRSPTQDDPTGRGLRIVADLSDEWGFDSNDTSGNHVWFVIQIEDAASTHDNSDRHAAREPTRQPPPPSADRGRIRVDGQPDGMSGRAILHQVGDRISVCAGDRLILESCTNASDCRLYVHLGTWTALDDELAAAITGGSVGNTSRTA